MLKVAKLQTSEFSMEVWEELHLMFAIFLQEKHGRVLRKADAYVAENLIGFNGCKASII